MWRFCKRAAVHLKMLSQKIISNAYIRCAQACMNAGTIKLPLVRCGCRMHSCISFMIDCPSLYFALKYCGHSCLQYSPVRAMSVWLLVSQCGKQGWVRRGVL